MSRGKGAKGKGSSSGKGPKGNAAGSKGGIHGPRASGASKAGEGGAFSPGHHKTKSTSKHKKSL